MFFVGFVFASIPLKNVNMKHFICPQRGRGKFTFCLEDFQLFFVVNDNYLNTFHVDCWSAILIHH